MTPVGCGNSPVLQKIARAPAGCGNSPVLQKIARAPVLQEMVNQPPPQQDETASEERQQDTCSACNAHLIIMDDGFPTCSNSECGILNKDTLDFSPEWRFFGGDDKRGADPTRCGNPVNPLLKESSYGCKIICGPKASYEMKCIRKWTEWISMPHKEKTLYDEFQYITRMAHNANMPRIFIDDAMAIHKDISEQKMFRGMNRDGIKAASIYLACRFHGWPRTAHEIAEIFRLDKAAATSGCSMAVTILSNLDRNGHSTMFSSDMCATKPSAFVERYCSRLRFTAELTHLSHFIAMKIERHGWIDDNTPHAVAAGVVFFVSQVCQFPLTKTDVKAVCGVSEVTINKCYKKMVQLKTELVPSSILNRGS